MAPPERIALAQIGRDVRWVRCRRGQNSIWTLLWRLHTAGRCTTQKPLAGAQHAPR